MAINNYKNKKVFVSTYSYDCELAFNAKNGQQYEIEQPAIKCIIIKHDYRNSIMPIIYIKVNIKPSVYNMMVPEQGVSKMYLKLYRTKKKGSTSSAPKKVIYDEFDYYMTDDPNGYKKLDENNEGNGTSYKECFIGLVKIDLQKQNQKTFEGVYKNTNSMSLVQAATKGMKMVIQPFKYNKTFASFVCPTVNSIGQFIAVLNNKASFYKGSYTYYMDFDKTYLRSNDGAYIDAKDGDYKYIALDVRDLTAYKSLQTGQIEDDSQDAYILYVNANDVQINIDRVTSSLVGTVQATDPRAGDTTDVSKVNTKMITNIGTAGSSYVYISMDPNAASNATTRIAESSDTLIFNKMDMDSRIFTPNKQYLLCNYEDNPKYCGVYYMTNREEIYLRNGDQMSCQITVTLKKTADFV